MIGRAVTLEKSSDSEVAVCLDGTVVGHLDASVGNQLALAIDRGQSFTAVIINGYPIYDDNFKQTSTDIDLKVEYLLEKNQPAIEAFRMDQGEKFQCRINNLTGGGWGRSLGVNIEVTECEFDDVPPRTTLWGVGPHQNILQGEPSPSRGLGWLFFAAAVVLLLIVVLIRNSS